MGTKGFEIIVKDIQQKHHKYIFFLGSAYDVHSRFPPFPAPYESERGRFDRILGDSGIKLIELFQY